MATPLDLNLLSKGSARGATFVVRVAQGRCVEYTYTQKGSNNRTTAHQFEAYLVGIRGEGYCVGFVRGPLATCKAAAEKFADGSSWHLSKVCLDTKTPSALISTPAPLRVDLSKSTLTAANSDSGATQPAAHPVPPRTVAMAGLAPQPGDQQAASAVPP